MGTGADIEGTIKGERENLNFVKRNTSIDIQQIRVRRRVYGFQK